MLKRIFVSLGLFSQLAWAAPSPLDQPGSFFTPAERERVLAGWERDCRKRGDSAGLLEVECRRLIPLLRRYDPSCPARVGVLRQRLASLAPGRSRAYVYWVLAWDAAMRAHREALNEYVNAALKEPGLNLHELARMCNAMDDAFCGYLEAPTRSAMVALLSKEPAADVVWASLSLQRHSARLSGQRELGNSLDWARVNLAQKEGWAYEQIWVLMSADDRVDWKQMVRLSRGNDGLRRWILREAPNPQEHERAARELKVALSPEEVILERFKFVDLDTKIQLHGSLARLYQREGRVEDEIVQHTWLAITHEKKGQLEAALRQRQAALQCRLDHPLSDPEWVGRWGRKGKLARDLAELLEKTGRLHQLQALYEGALEQGWCDDPRDQFTMHSELLKRAQVQGDGPGWLSHWQAGLGLIRQIPQGHRDYSLFLLAKEAPPSQASARPELLRQARLEAEASLRGQKTMDRQNALVTLNNILEMQGDEAARLQLWAGEVQQARQRGNGATLDDSLLNLIKMHLQAGRLAEAKELARGRLGEQNLAVWMEEEIYSLAPLLAEKGDPDGLVWADRGLARAKDTNSLRKAVKAQLRVLLAFQRYEAVLAAAGKADGLKLGLATQVEVEKARAAALWKLEHREESVAGLRRFLTRVLASEEPGRAVEVAKALALYESEWEGSFEAAMRRFVELDERGEKPRRELLLSWLERLAERGEWERGREVLRRYPWGQGLDSATQKLQKFPQWRDLLPGAEQAGVDPTSLTALVDELRLSSPELGQLLSLRSTNLKQLQARLSPNDTLVTFCSTGEQLYVLALRKDKGFWSKTALTGGQLASLQREYLQSLSSNTPGAAEALLQAALLAPVLTGEPNQRLYLVPSGDLWQLPFGALRDGQGRSAASQAELVLLSSGDLLRLADRSWQPYRLSQPLAIGAPSPLDLPGAYQELEEVSRVLPGCTLRRGEEATSEALYAPAQRWGLLHFASHAHYNSHRPLESDIELRDGPLKLKQLSQLSLDEHCLVTLSVCQGGAAGGQRVDEPVTLATGFSAAGAETVVANLWPVDDEVARIFFTAFYRELAAGATPLASFRLAQDNTRLTYPKARDWAGFFFLGNPT